MRPRQPERKRTRDETRLSNLWTTIHTSFWAIPLPGLVLATVLALVTSAADRHLSASASFTGTPWIGLGDLDVVRTLLRVYMDRRFVQIVLATFADSSLYCFLQK